MKPSEAYLQHAQECERQAAAAQSNAARELLLETAAQLERLNAHHEIDGVADRLLKVRIRKTDVAADAFGSPPGIRALGAEAMKLGDERGRVRGHRPAYWSG